MNEEQSNKSVETKTGQAGISLNSAGTPSFDNRNEAFSQLFDVISKLGDEPDRERAETNAKALQAAVESGNKFKAREFVRILEESVGRIQALIAIDRIIGIPDETITR